MAELLRENGLANVQQAVGMDVDKKWKTWSAAHSALKLEKSAISKVQKHIISIFKNGKKSIFAQEKSL